MSEWLVLLNALMPLLIAVVTIFGGVGFWAWKNKKVDSAAEQQNSMMLHLVNNEKRYQEDVSLRLASLAGQVDALHASKLELVREVAQLRAQLKAAREEITALRVAIR